MPMINKPVAYRVIIIESERGWGSKIDEELYFDNEAEAVAYVKKYNANLPDGPAPDWYMMARYEGKV